MLEFPKNYFEPEKRCGFYITSMMKRFWASELEILSFVDSLCKKHGIRYCMCFGSLIGTVRHKGFIPWDDDIDIGMLRGDYELFAEVFNSEKPDYITSKSLLPGAIPPKELIFNINNGSRLDTSPEHLERFHGCPYATGIDLYVFDKIPDDPEAYEYQQKLIYTLDKLLMLQWDVENGKKDDETINRYFSLRNAVEAEFEYKFTYDGLMTVQILKLMDMACALCNDSASGRVECMEQMLYYGDRGFKEKHFTELLTVPYEDVIDVPIPRDYDWLLHRIFGDYHIAKKFTGQHSYPAYIGQREALYRAYSERGMRVPEEFLERDENGELIVDPDNLTA